MVVFACLPAGHRDKHGAARKDSGTTTTTTNAHTDGVVVTNGHLFCWGLVLPFAWPPLLLPLR